MSHGSKINFHGDTWAAHRQSDWLEFAGHPNYPDHLRIVFVAYGLHTANGHARLRQGELARYLVRKDGALPDRRTIHRAVQQAIDLGFLSASSRLLCLVVTSHHVQGGRGNPDEPCPRDHTTHRRNVGNSDRPSRRNVGDGTGRFTSNVGDDRRRLALMPSISLTTAPAGAGTEPDRSDVG
jgi:hypothetical protein